MKQNFEVSKQLAQLIGIHEKRIARYTVIVQKISNDNVVLKAILSGMIEDSLEIAKDIRAEYFDPSVRFDFEKRYALSVNVYDALIKIVSPFVAYLPVFMVRFICNRTEARIQRTYGEVMKANLPVSVRQNIIRQQTMVKDANGMLIRYKRNHQ